MPFVKGHKKEGGIKKGGKHAKTKSAERQRKLFNKMVDAKWKDIISAQIEDSIKDYKPREYVINQRIGKAKESVEAVVELKGLVLDI